jgi:hypothetical protein
MYGGNNFLKHKKNALEILVSVYVEFKVRSESRCALRLRHVNLVVSIEVAVEVCCFFHYMQLLNSG